MAVCSNTFRFMVIVLTLAVGVLGIGACTASNPTAGVSCAWGIKADKNNFNVAFPDATATYFVTKYKLLPGQKLVLTGTYPYARYMSLHTYTLRGEDIDHIPDRLIVPDPGSDNPFTNLAASIIPAKRRWTVTISPEATVQNGQDGANTISTPHVGSVMLRVYVTDNPLDQTGGVPLPQISVIDADGTTTAVLPTCTTQGPSPVGAFLVNLFGPATDKPPNDPPFFKRPLAVAGYPNRDNAYLASIAAYKPGKVIVVRGKAPTTPDTQAGQSPATPAQLRYWSFCTNEYRKPYPVSFCAIDHEAPLDGSGYYTIVVSTPDERPDNANTVHGVTWIDWGSTATNLMMAFRHMLPDPEFAETVSNVAPGQLASEVMGDYTPVAVTCNVATFEAGGFAACGL